MNRWLLIVDDDTAQREALTRRFTRAGYRVLSVGHPRCALEAASFRQFHVALLDASLPEIDGFQLMRQLEQTQEAVNFVIMCGNEYPRRNAKDIGAFACLLKPCNLAHLEMIVDEAFEKAVVEKPQAEPAGKAH